MPRKRSARITPANEYDQTIWGDLLYFIDKSVLSLKGEKLYRGKPRAKPSMAGKGPVRRDWGEELYHMDESRDVMPDYGRSGFVVDQAAGRATEVGPPHQTLDRMPEAQPGVAKDWTLEKWKM